MGSLEWEKDRGARTDERVRSSLEQFAVLYLVAMVNVLMTNVLCMFLVQLWEPVKQALSLAAFPSHKCGSVCTRDGQCAKGKSICGVLLDWGAPRAG